MALLNSHSGLESDTSEPWGRSLHTPGPVPHVQSGGSSELKGLCPHPGKAGLEISKFQIPGHGWARLVWFAEDQLCQWG